MPAWNCMLLHEKLYCKLYLNQLFDLWERFKLSLIIELENGNIFGGLIYQVLKNYHHICR